MSEAEQPELARLTVELLSAYVSNNTVASSELPGLIEATRAALAGEAAQAAEQPPEFKPAASIEDSLASPDHILSLIDGKPYKALKRHLSNNGLTPDEYKTRYNLPASYPLVAKNYSEQRSKVARNMGLGGSRSTAPKGVASPVETPKLDAKEVTDQKASAKSGKARVAKVSATTAAKAAVSAGAAKAEAPKAEANAAGAVSPAAAAKQVAKSRAAKKVSTKAKQTPAPKTSPNPAAKSAVKAGTAPSAPALASKGEESVPAAVAVPAKGRGKPSRTLALLQSLGANDALSEAGLPASAAATVPTAKAGSPAERKPRKKLGISVGAPSIAAKPAEPAKPADKVAAKAESKPRAKPAGSGKKAPKASAPAAKAEPANAEQAASADT